MVGNQMGKLIGDVVGLISKNEVEQDPSDDERYCGWS
jgi:hypothetical protein